MEKDFLEELVDEETRRDSEYPTRLEEGVRRRRLALHLSAERSRQSLSQTIVAARMGTSASVISKLEAGFDVKLSTLQRYAAAVGKVLSFSLDDPPPPARRRRKPKPR